ncbi:Subtilin biosynthesis protein SpaC, partial [Paenibacillus sp. 28ISP30-2]|nr:Subtilin biosynthesis protein SpaC [Paenibacillus sp. 28ISP30-2]
MLAAYSNIDIHISDYDVIEGLSGIANYLLIFSEDKKMRSLLVDILQYLVRLADDKEYQGLKIPGWHIPSQNQFTQMEEQLYPEGNFNLGLSHGIAGPIVALSKAMLQGINVPGQERAIKKMVEFLIQFASMDGEHLFWKGVISFEEFKAGCASSHVDFRRDAWCYGNPGVCIALLYAGKALEEPKYTDLALQNLRETAQNVHHVLSPTFCHGYAGIAQILMAAQKISGKDIFNEEIMLFKNKIMSFYDESYPFGFYDFEGGVDDRGVKKL